MPAAIVENFDGLEATGTVVSMTDAKIEKLEKQVAELLAENAKLRDRIAFLEEENFRLREENFRLLQQLRESGDTLLEHQQPRKK